MSKLFIGCDASKGYADFVVLDENREVVEKGFQLDDTQKGHTAFRKYIGKLVEKYPDTVLHAGVESTGCYENNWLAEMRELSNLFPLKSARINPCGIKKFKEAEMVRCSTDEVSSAAIAGYMQAHPRKVIYDQDDQFYTARRQWNSIALMKKAKVQLQNSLHMQLYTSNPGLLRYCSFGMPGWILKLLAKYPTALQLGRARLQSIMKCAGISMKKAEGVQKNVKESVSSTTDEFTVWTIQQLVFQIRSLEKSIAVLEKELAKKWASHPSVKLCSSIGGVGITSALGLLINIRDVRLYSSVSNLTSYFGMHPVYRVSGDGKAGFHLSKKGRVQPRAILFMCVLNGIRHNPVIRELYKKCLRKGMNRMAAIGVCMHKLLRIVYGVLKNNTPFDPEIDRKNREKRKNNTGIDPELQYQKRVRRYQPVDDFAPVSARQSKKRKGNGSQSALAPNTGSPRPTEEKKYNGQEINPTGMADKEIVPISIK